MISSLFFFIIATYARQNIILLNEGRPVDDWHINTTDANTSITLIEQYKYLSSDLVQSYSIFNLHPIATSYMNSIQFLFYVQPKGNEQYIPIEVDIRNTQNKQNYQSYVSTFYAQTNKVNEVIIPINMDWIESIRFRICQKETEIKYDYLMSYVANMQMTDSVTFLPWNVEPKSEEIIPVAVSSTEPTISSVPDVPSVVPSVVPPVVSSSEQIYFKPINWNCENGSSSIFILMMICFFIFI